MERYFQIGLVGCAAVAFIPAFFFFFRAALHFVKMLGHFRSSKHDMAANFFPVLMPWMPHLFTDQGNVHRIAFNRNLLAFLCCVAFIAAVFVTLGVSK